MARTSDAASSPAPFVQASTDAAVRTVILSAVAEHDGGTLSRSTKETRSEAPQLSQAERFKALQKCDPTVARQQCLALAEEGYWKAMIAVAKYLHSGKTIDGLKPELAHASVWYEKAAKEGSKESKHYWALCLLDGAGGAQKDVSKGVHLMEELIQVNYRRSLHELILFYRYRHGNASPASVRKELQLLLRAEQDPKINFASVYEAGCRLHDGLPATFVNLDVVTTNVSLHEDVSYQHLQQWLQIRPPSTWQEVGDLPKVGSASHGFAQRVCVTLDESDSDDEDMGPWGEPTLSDQLAQLESQLQSSSHCFVPGGAAGSKADTWVARWKFAASKGYPPAFSRLGQYYCEQKPKGGVRNVPEAIKWLRAGIASVQTEDYNFVKSECLYRLGLCLSEGNPPGTAEQKIAALFNEAHLLKHNGASYQLGRLRLREAEAGGASASKRRIEARKLLIIAAKGRNGEAISFLLANFRGRTPHKDAILRPKEARLAIRLAEKGTHGLSLYEAYLYYRDGCDALAVQVDHQRALGLLQRAADAHHPESA